MLRKRLAIDHQGERIEFTITHRPRVTRRVHLELDQDGFLQVVKPRRMSQRAVQRLLQENTTWVAKFIGTARRKQQDLPPLTYLDGERHLFLGEYYPVQRGASTTRGTAVRLERGAFELRGGDGSLEQARQRMRYWYRQQAMAIFGDRLEHIAANARWVGNELPVLRLRRMKRTWGSCSIKGVITLNPHLVKAPLDCIDYVIAHELCHLVEHNHGRGFYRLQEQLNPQWRSQREHLRSRGHIYLHD